jgi:hypothetical protein
MSIDARVQKVLFNSDGSGRLELIDRPARRGQTPGERGQAALRFQQSFASVAELEGCNIWGNDSLIMLGDTMIARRKTYTEIEFVSRQDFLTALGAYKGN